MSRKLYYTSRSPYARKVRIVLAEKQLPCEMIETDIKQKSPEFLQLNPIGKIPVLVDDNGLIFWDSTLIVEYLDDSYPTPSFYPSGRSERLRCRQGEELADTLIDEVVALWYETRKGGDANPQVQALHQGNIDRLIAVFEQQLGTTSHLLSDQITAVDIAAISGLGYYSLRFGKDWQSSYPRLAQWFDQLHQRPSLQDTIPKA
ncbi:MULTISPECIES: glutathione S-transferase family protein [unclassified Leptolyngbya]|uniref:glutathione S-transferase family protein n=1 Tax=unclassified Leptolyngbya TaxID=2650499 RepID=UPI001689C34C|nr:MULTISPECIES: glutathione S-transferase family protein [unclassified Leptolyngbya]MBD1909324.1 glutathione S-transferase family protein [Leptolyngbya sp. FACHB-8]MBD2158182.1 glutathione S-transferase family protein [Leptolyngbya sp. FACHB-16]